MSALLERRDHKSKSSSTDRNPKSNFKNTLKSIQVPTELREGVHVLRVYANGKTQECYISLSEDKFTLYITTKRKKNISHSPSHSSQYFGSPISRKAASSLGIFFGGGRKTNSNLVAAAAAAAPLQQEQAIDIGAIGRIQRGHATKRFELARRQRQHSLRSLASNGSSGNKYSALPGENEESMYLNPSQCFSILFRGDWTLDLMMLSADSKRDAILDALDDILKTYQEQKRRVSNDVLLLRYHWLDAVSDKDAQRIKSNELQKLLQEMNYLLKPRELNDVYEKFARAIGLDRKLRRQGLTFEQTCTLLHKIKRDSWIVKPVHLYWNKLFGEFMNNSKPRMTVSDKTFLEKFLRRTQGENASLEDVRALFARLNALELPHIAGESAEKDPTRIDRNRFEAYLLLEENDAFDPIRQQFSPESMHKPLSEYWINSSHNTYLTGDQWTSNSSVEMYSNALYRGCRCLELDIWDGDLGEDGLPRAVVWHGHTMTSKILFRDIIMALKLFLNFHPDTFPLILSFEIHCTVPYQEIMAEQLVQILGKALYIPKEEDLTGDLPSPWDLRGMVIIKGRRPSFLNYDGYDTDDDNSDDGAPSTIFSADSPVPPVKKVHHRICPGLARLTLFHGTKLRNWETSQRNPTHHMHSFSETKLRSVARKTDRHEWALYNKTHMSRIYPAGSRIDSSNFVPILGWSLGCQMMSLNFQTSDAPLLLNDGRFRENGGCGYVPKPDSIIQQQQTTGEPRKPMKISIRVLSGHCLPKPKEKRGDKCIDPYVRVSVYDVKNGIKEETSTYQTNVVYNNGFFPIWNEERFTFTVEGWAAAMLQLSVYDKEVAPSSDEFVATAAIPISCLRQGLRSVKLTDSTNTRSGAFDFASLLIEVKKSWGSSSVDGIEKPDSISSMSKSDHVSLERSRTDHSRGSWQSNGIARPEQIERSKTEESYRHESYCRGGNNGIERPSRLQRARTDHSRIDSSLGSEPVLPMPHPRSETNEVDQSLAEF